MSTVAFDINLYCVGVGDFKFASNIKQSRYRPEVAQRVPGS